MNNQAYPVVFRNITKLIPSFVVLLGFSSVFSLVLYNTLYHAHERIEKYYFRSNRFERLSRRRDEVSRIYFKEMMDWQPNSNAKQLKPLLRF